MCNVLFHVPQVSKRWGGGQKNLPHLQKRGAALGSIGMQPVAKMLSDKLVNCCMLSKDWQYSQVYCILYTRTCVQHLSWKLSDRPQVKFGPGNLCVVSFLIL